MSDQSRMWEDGTEPPPPGQRQESAEKATASAGPRARRRYVSIDRAQEWLRRVRPENLIPGDHLVRFIWDLVGQMDLSKFEESILVTETGPGRPAYAPQLLICIWLYAYTEGVGSSREIERRMETDPALQWLAGFAVISAYTLSNFRVDHQEALQQLFTDVLTVIRNEGQVTLERVMQDGTKIKAAGSRYSFRGQSSLERYQEQARQYLEQVQKQGEQEDQRQKQQEQSGERVKTQEERFGEERVEKLKRSLEELEELKKLNSTRAEKKAEDQLRVSRTEPEARKMQHRDGSYHPSYNVQFNTDAKAKIIVAVEVSQETNDFPLMVSGVEQVKQRTGQYPKQLVDDGGYTTSHHNILSAAALGVELYGPNFEGEKKEKQAKEKDKPLSAEQQFRARFEYQKATNTYVCPQGNTMKPLQERDKPGGVKHVYKAAAGACKVCPLKPQCCPTNKGERTISHVELDPVVLQFQEKMATEEAKAIYAKRGEVAEFPNLWIKEKFNLRRFHVFGKAKAEMEAVWAALAYNIQQFIRISGTGAKAPG